MAPKKQRTKSQAQQCFDTSVWKLIEEERSSIEEQLSSMSQQVKGSIAESLASTTELIESLREQVDKPFMKEASAPVGTCHDRQLRNEARKELLNYLPSSFVHFNLLLSTQTRPKLVFDSQRKKLQTRIQKLETLSLQIAEALDRVKLAAETTFQATEEQFNTELDSHFCQQRGHAEACCDELQKALLEVHSQEMTERAHSRELLYAQLEVLNIDCSKYLKANESPSKNINYHDTILRQENLKARLSELDKPSEVGQLAKRQKLTSDRFGCILS